MSFSVLPYYKISNNNFNKEIQMGTLLKIVLLTGIILYATVKFKDVIMPVAETGTAVVDVLVDKAGDNIDTLVKEAEQKKKLGVDNGTP